MNSFEQWLAAVMNLDARIAMSMAVLRDGETAAQWRNYNPETAPPDVPNAPAEAAVPAHAMPDLALMLMIYVDRPIVDQTGLQGRYDFQLQWTKDEAVITGMDAPPGLFTAMQEQLGLRLKPAKTAVDVLVVDRVEKPSPN